MVQVQVSNDNGSTWYDIPTPATYQLAFEDLDLDSYRSVINGNLNRNVLNRRWCKLSLSYRYLEETDIDTMLPKVNNSNLKVKITSPAFGSGTIEFKAYVSKLNLEQIEGTSGYNCSFNIIQMEANNAWQ